MPERSVKFNESYHSQYSANMPATLVDRAVTKGFSPGTMSRAVIKF